MGMFSGVKEAKPNFGANYERPGKYIMFIRRVKLDKNRNQDWFVAVEKTSIECLDALDEPKPHRPGEQCSHLLPNYGPGKPNFLPNFKAMIMNVFEVPEEDIDEDACDVITDETQPMAGLFVEMQNIGITTKKGDPFTKIKYVRSIPRAEIAAKVNRDILARAMSEEELAYFDAKLAEESD